MKTEQDREQLIEAINVLLTQSYDDTLDEIYALLLKIEEEEDEADLRAYEHAMKNGGESIAWDDAKKILDNEVNKEVA